MVTQKSIRSWKQAKHIAYETKGLEGSPGIWVELRESHVERLKDTHREIIERKENV